MVRTSKAPSSKQLEFEELRKRAGFATNIALAAECEFPPDYISKMCMGWLGTVRVRNRLLEALKCSVEDLDRAIHLSAERYRREELTPFDSGK